MTPFVRSLWLTASLILVAPHILSADTVLATEPRAQVAEIVTFRLIEGADPSAFSAAAQSMTPFLAATGAVLSRSLSQAEDGTWTDHITWTDLETAQASAAQVMELPEALPFMSLIDPDSVSLRYETIWMNSE